jgi:hypothetical protein
MQCRLLFDLAQMADERGCRHILGAAAEAMNVSRMMHHCEIRGRSWRRPLH